MQLLQYHSAKMKFNHLNTDIEPSRCHHYTNSPAKEMCTRGLLLLLAILSCNTSAAANAEMEEITVIGRADFLETKFTPRRTGSPVDAARLMAQVPGGAANSNGPLTGQIQYRGMFGPRINVRVDGLLIHGGGPNWMAPPLHHIPAGLMQELVVERGIASISSGGGIGGAVTAYWKKPEYNHRDDWLFSGDTEATLSSVDQGSSVSAVIGLSDRVQRFYIVGNKDKGDDYDTGRDETHTTRYERQVAGLGYGLKLGNHEFDVDFRRLETDDTGTPSLPMDIDWFHTDLWKAGYRTHFKELGIEAMIYGSRVDHGMSNDRLRPVPDFSMLPLPPFLGDDKRRVKAKSDEIGYKLTIDTMIAKGSFSTGIEGKHSEHDAVVSDPDFAPFFVTNFNDSEVDRLALFGQWSSLIGDRWYVEAGASLAKVKTDTDPVDAFPARLVDMNPSAWPMGTPPRAVWMLRENFNASDHSQSENHLDWLLKIRYQATEQLMVEAGLAQKVRSPLYQERYLWIPLEANAGLGDGNNYIGDVDLDPERSRQIELGLDWNYNDYNLSPRIFYREVDDYIQGVPVTNPVVVAVSSKANGDPTPLQFSNTEARFWGVDMTFGIQFGDRWRLDGMASYVRGDRDDISDSLFRIAPASLRVELLYEGDQFNARIQQMLVAEQDRLSATNTLDPQNPNNSFNPSKRYALTNAFLSWFVSDKMTVTAGAENLFDQDRLDHLTGFNRVAMNNVPVGSHLRIRGRNLFGRIQYRW